MTTGKEEQETAVGSLVSPFPVKNGFRYVCMVIRGLESILRGVSLLLYKNNIVDRKWMNLLIFFANLLQYLCNSLSKLDKLKDGEK